MTKVENISRAKIQKVVRQGGVTINGIVVQAPNCKVKVGDLVGFSEEEIPDDRPNLSPDASVPFEILYEDEDVLVIDKPAGVVVHAGAGNRNHTLVNGLIHHCNLSLGSSEFRPGIVHRIDKDTSGILVIAKNDFAHAFLANQFAVHSITRKYVCFCYGVPRPAMKKIETQIARDKNNRLKMAVYENVEKDIGKHAITIYRVLDTYGNFAAKVECELKTGRTHQIRVHMSHLGHSLIGDSLYKHKNYALPKSIADQVNHFSRQALHAKYIEFIHPSTKKNMVFENELPDDLIELEEKMRNFSNRW